MWWVLLQSLKMITVKAISKCFVKFSLIENVSIFKCLTLLTNISKFTSRNPVSWKFRISFSILLKVFLLVPCLLDFVGVKFLFLIYHFGKSKHFVHSVLFITSLVSSISLWPSKEVEEASLISPFEKLSTSFIIFIIFLVLNIHFETICLLFSISIKQLFSYLLTFSYLDVLK